MWKKDWEFTEGFTGKDLKARRLVCSETNELMVVWPGSKERRGREYGWKGRSGPDLEACTFPRGNKDSSVVRGKTNNLV